MLAQKRGLPLRARPRPQQQQQPPPPEQQHQLQQQQRTKVLSGRRRADTPWRTALGDGKPGSPRAPLAVPALLGAVSAGCLRALDSLMAAARSLHPCCRGRRRAAAVHVPATSSRRPCVTTGPAARCRPAHGLPWAASCSDGEPLSCAILLAELHSEGPPFSGGRGGTSRPSSLVLAPCCRFCSGSSVPTPASAQIGFRPEPSSSLASSR